MASIAKGSRWRLKGGARVLVQVTTAALFVAVYLTFVDAAPAHRLAAAINYSYRLIAPNVANDGTP